MLVYYLTGATFALSNLALRRVKVSRFRDLNDPFELLGVNLADKKHRSAFRITKQQVDEITGLVCFSRSWKNPLLWGHYGEKHTGVALGFEVPDDRLVPVVYAKKLLSFALDKKTNRPPEGLVDELIKTKFFDWKYEKEVRLFVDLRGDRAESGLYYCPFSDYLRLRNVILGPKCELPIASIRKLVSDIEPRVEVVQSRIAFTRFEVLENRTASRADSDV